MYIEFGCELFGEYVVVVGEYDFVVVDFVVV